MSAKSLSSLSRRRTRKKKNFFHVGSQSLASCSIQRGTLQFFSLPTKPLMARHHHIFKSLQYPIIQLDLCAPRMQSDLWSLESRLTRDFPKHPRVLSPLLYFSFCSQSMFHHQNMILTSYFADSRGSLFRHAAVVVRIIVHLAVWEMVLLCLTSPVVIYPTSIFLYSSTELLIVRQLPSRSRSYLKAIVLLNSIFLLTCSQGLGKLIFEKEMNNSVFNLK